MYLLYNMLSRLVIAFLPRSKHLLISWLQSPSAVILQPPKIKSVTVSIVSPSIYHGVMAPDAMIFVFCILSFKPKFSLSSFTFIKGLLSSSSLSAIRVVSSAYLRLLIFLPETWFQLVLHPAQHFAWWSESCSVVSDSLPTHGLYSPGNSPGQNAGVGSLSLLQGIFPTQGSNPGLPHCRQILYQLGHKGTPGILEWVAYPFFSGSSWPRTRTGVSCIAGGFFTNWAWCILHIS